MRAACAAGLVLLLGASASAEESSERLSFEISDRAGLVRAPFVTSTFPEVSGFGMRLTAAAAVRLASLDWRVTLPVGVVWLDFPAGAHVTETVLGNLELGVEHEAPLSPSTSVGLLAALLAPSAGQGSRTSLLDNRALALVSALNGGKDSALLTPGVSGLRLQASVDHSEPPFELRASVDLALLVRLSDASLPEETQTHAVGVWSALDLGATLPITSWFGATLGGALSAQPVRVHELALERHRERWLQALVEPGVYMKIGQATVLGLDGSIPVGGNLGGDAWSVCIHARRAL